MLDFRSFLRFFSWFFRGVPILCLKVFLGLPKFSDVMFVCFRICSDAICVGAKLSEVLFVGFPRSFDVPFASFLRFCYVIFVGFPKLSDGGL